MEDRTEKLKAWARDLAPPRSDVRIALEVIGRRAANRIVLEKAENYRLDLRKANLQGAELRGAHLEGADLWEARLEGAILSGAHLEGAILSGAHLEGASLGEAHLEGAFLGWAHLEGANLVWARLEGANLVWAHLEGASLEGARLEGAGLVVARLEGAFLEGARLDNRTSFTAATLRGAAVKDVDFTPIALTQDQIDSAFGDGSTKLGNLKRPAHWPSADLNGHEFEEEWRRYLSNPASYVPPQDRA
ncbi:pentapeptide repeat-containing protein [Rhodovulum sp. P5]|uniref:pentapeptide repeat-containing protein n=1 Tax=Rhodovulum sp. P5 TaxID=1564506 RepID=UPI0009D9D5DE|nr:pentapeptide repeat-containing protein [Rhodovulum sp. P5]